MLDESTAHLHEIIVDATRLMTLYCKTPVNFSKVIQLSEPDRRNMILRLLIENPQKGMPQTIILKQTATDTNKFDIATSETEIEKRTRFAHDWAGIEFLTEIGSDHAPHFYGGSLEHTFILIEDLGVSHPSLVGPLTRAPSGINVQEAERALISYVRRIARMQIDTLGKSAQFTSILHRVYPEALRCNFLSEVEKAKTLHQFKILICQESDELGEEIQKILEFTKSNDTFHVLLHGDICPDNVYYQGDEIKLIDFEFSDFGNALIDGVYLRMNMPSCWCSKAVPDTVLHKMESAYREELRKKIPEANDNLIYDRYVTYSCAYWLIRTISTMNVVDNEWICPSGPLDPDSTWDPKENGFRPRILSRLKAFIEYSRNTGHLPTFCKASTQLLSHLQKIWPQAGYIDLFPVFKEKNPSEEERVI